jgi:hypothetical protein
LQDVHELVLVLVPVPMTRPRARGERHQVDAKLRESRCGAKSDATPASTRLVKRRRIG